MFSFFQELRERHVPHVLAVYIGASWGIIQFVSFLEERYLLSPHLTDLTLFSVALLLPSVVLVTYNVGRPGRDPWSRSTKLGVPANLMIAGGVLFFTFSGKTLGAVTTTLSVIDETGQSIERVVPRAEFRKRLAIFEFDAAPSDTAGQWMRYGLSRALYTDLQQDIFIDLRCSCTFVEDLRKAGYRDGSDVPLALKRKIAQERHLGYFVTGDVRADAAGVKLTLSLYETQRGRLVQERSYSGTDPLALIDEASVQLRRDLQIPARHIEETTDMPVAELMSRSLPALRQFADGYVAMLYEKDFGAAVRHFTAALERDPGFVLAELNRSNTYTSLGDGARAAASLQAVVDQLFRLPEPIQFQVRTRYFTTRGEPEKALAVARMAVELFPEDLDSHLVLASLHRQRDETTDAIAAYRRVLELDPQQTEYLRFIGALYERKGDVARAIDHFGRYVRLHPNEAAAHLPLGDLNRRRGDYAAARESFQRAIVLDPGNVGTQLRMADLERDHGSFDEAERLYRNALESARTGVDSMQVYGSLRTYHFFRGRLQAAVEYNARRAAAAERVSPLAAAADQMEWLALHVVASDSETAFRRFDELVHRIPPPFDGVYAAVGKLAIYLELEQPEPAAEALARLENEIAVHSINALEPSAIEIRGRIEALRDRCDLAVPSFRKKLEMDPSDTRPFGRLGHCYHQLGRIDDAIASYRRVLTVVPFDGRNNYELGLVYRDAGNRALALEHLRRAVQVWENADAGFSRAAEARAALAALQ
jgi:tetratricopeptide (TPR) repeat protein